MRWTLIFFGLEGFLLASFNICLVSNIEEYILDCIGVFYNMISREAWVKNVQVSIPYMPNICFFVFLI
jgi:hypothetical protein